MAAIFSALAASFCLCSATAAARSSWTAAVTCSVRRVNSSSMMRVCGLPAMSSSCCSSISPPSARFFSAFSIFCRRFWMVRRRRYITSWTGPMVGARGSPEEAVAVSAIEEGSRWGREEDLKRRRGGVEICLLGSVSRRAFASRSADTGAGECEETSTRGSRVRGDRWGRAPQRRVRDALWCARGRLANVRTSSSHVPPIAKTIPHQLPGL